MFDFVLDGENVVKSLLIGRLLEDKGFNVLILKRRLASSSKKLLTISTRDCKVIKEFWDVEFSLVGKIAPEAVEECLSKWFGLSILVEDYIELCDKSVIKTRHKGSILYSSKITSKNCCESMNRILNSAINKVQDVLGFNVTFNDFLEEIYK